MAEEYKYLSHIDSPADLKQLPEDVLPEVCKELRTFIIDELSNNPGHFASSLGVVELTVALHYVYSVPTDRLVWDVGHQAYAHKILTGRRDRFYTNRKFGGLAPFPSPMESECDSFVSGHASNSISAALGMAVADQLKNERFRKIVAIIGDGSLTGGLAFEGLNNMSSNPNDLLVVLNDNQMAIDPVVGGLSHYLTKITTSTTYNRWRYKIARWFKQHNWLRNKGVILRMNNSIKTAVAREHNIFEGLDIRYFGPVDGHDVLELVRILKTIKDFQGPKVLHIKTVKGKGFEQAEHDPTIWHAPGKFDKETEQRQPSEKNAIPLYQDVFGNTLLELARRNDKIVGVTPAMPSGSSLTILGKEYPHRMFDVGIAEGHAVTFSAGMAKEGLVPYCVIYSSFAQRAYDNIIHDVALQKLNMVLCLDRAGLVGNDGATHHGVFDVPALRCVPNLTIASPMNEPELRNMLYTAQLPQKGTVVIRYPRGRGVTEDWKTPMKEILFGKGRCVKEGKNLAILSFGPIGNLALKAISNVEKELQDKTIALYDMRFVKPLDTELLNEVAQKFSSIITMEDGALSGGFGSAVVEYLDDNKMKNNVHRLGIPDHFVEHGTVDELYKTIGMDCDSVCAIIKKMIN